MQPHRRIIIGVGLTAAVISMLLTGVVGGIAGYFVAAKFGSFLPTPTSTVTTSTGKTIQVTEEESAVINVVSKVSPAVVSIVGKGYDPFSGGLSNQTAGTGFILDSTGLIVTNAHVLPSGENSFTVITSDNKTYTANSISRDTTNDVAFLRINATNLPTVTLGDSGSLQVGQTVIAIGNALGEFNNTVSTGVVSGLNRKLSLSSSESFDNLIQTDAAINEGNSGGPLLNVAGEVVGINFAKATAENIGFAIPINTVKTVLANYRQNGGKIVRPFLGVATTLVTPDTAALDNIPEGALVDSVVPGSPAEAAGIQSNDVITAVDGQAVNQDNPLAPLIVSHRVGDTVQVRIWRSGQTLTVTAKLSQAP